MIVLRVLGFIVRLALLPLTAPWLFLRRRLPRNAWLQLDIEGSVTEFSARRPALPFLAMLQGQRGIALSAFHDLVDRVAKEPKVKGVVIVLRSLGAGMATATSLRKAIQRLRATGREVVVYLPNGGDTRELYVASAASRVLATPHATIAPVGFVSSSRYAKRALDKVGIGAERLAAGAYKSAGETFALDKMSDAQREQLGAVLDTFYEELVDAIAERLEAKRRGARTGGVGGAAPDDEARKADRERAKALVDGAPYSSERAQENGLIDDVAYEDELEKKLGDVHLVSADRFLASRRRRLLPELRKKPVLAVLPLHGAITSGSGPLAMDDRFIAAVRAARSNRRVRGVILHIDSPGGGALASDRIHHELVQLAHEKPVVAYFGNVAASGGYYAAAAAHHIVAEPTTITGSIGVVAARVVVEPLMQKLGIVTETLQRGAHATLLDPLHPVNEDERAVLETEIQSFYDGFLNVVATGRKRSKNEVHAVAQGRVWSGRDAKEKGLVDELGDGRAAVAALKSRVPNSQAMQLVAIRAPFSQKAPLPPAAMFVASLFGFDATAVHLAFSRERVLAYSVLPNLMF